MVSKEELLELIRKDRPTQTIHAVLDFRPHPLRGLCDVLYDVDLELDIPINLATNQTVMKVGTLKGFPYPVSPYRGLQNKWEQETIESWTNKQKE